jgi:heptaprenyl diphosphate synthase
MNLVHRMTLMAFFLAMAVVLSYVEGFIPFWLPGVKPGLANVVILIILYGFSWYDALLVDLGRVFLASLLRGVIFEMPFWMSLAGALASLLVMLLAKLLLKKLTIYGVSLLGAYVHSLAQVLVAVFFVGSWTVFYYFPFIALMSILTGLVTALVADRLLRSRLLDHPQGLSEAPRKTDG